MSIRTAIQFDELRTWMRKNNKGVRALGRDTGIDKMTLHRLLTGTFKRFDPDIIRRIHDATGGQVQERHFTAFFQRLRKEAA